MLQRVPGGSGGWVQFTVETLADDRLVGDVGLRVAEDEPGVVMVGYTMAPTAQGKGYATEAVGALVDYAFNTLGADVARAYADAANAPSVGWARRSAWSSSNGSTASTREKPGTGCAWSAAEHPISGKPVSP
jgi:hypothetical protein